MTPLLIQEIVRAKPWLMGWFKPLTDWFPACPCRESADYRAWRHQFLLDRLGLVLWIAIPCFLTFVIQDIYTQFVAPQEFEQEVMKRFGNLAIADQLRTLTLLSDAVVGLLILLCFALKRTTWGDRSPSVLFLCFSWSLTLAPQVISTLRGLPLPAADGWTLVFLAQATLMPVHWWLHLVSQVGLLLYYVGVNSALGLTHVPGMPIYEVGIFVYVFWVCLVCDLAVFLYERLKRSEFESRRELRVFLHSVSHDLRTPVMGTSMVLQNLLRKAKLAEGQVTVNAHLLERLLEGSDRQLHLINSLLEAHDTEVQGIVLHRQPIQLSLLVESVLADLAPLLNQNQIQVINRITLADLPPISGDTTQLWRVLSNLIGNAIKHNPPGITVTIEAVVVAKTLRCTVQDTGLGISAQQIQRLFELYSRGPRARYMPGLGLGLYLCRQIVVAHGGDIGVVSSSGQGTTFWFTLPLDLD